VLAAIERRPAILMTRSAPNQCEVPIPLGFDPREGAGFLPARLRRRRDPMLVPRRDPAGGARSNPSMVAELVLMGKSWGHLCANARALSQ